MKKFFALILCLMLSFSIVACDNQGQPDNLTFYAPDGAPALAIAKFINDSETFGIDAKIDYNVVSSNVLSL